MPYINSNIKNANLGWLFYKKYFVKPEAEHDKKIDSQNIGKDTLLNRNFSITHRKFSDQKDNFEIKSSNNFSLKTTYPGLLIGSGYSHEYGEGIDKDDAFKIGFFFDHISGLPCIPGHGIKGALRAAFPNHKDEKYPKEKSAFIVSMLEDTKTKFYEYIISRNITEGVYSDEIFTKMLGEIIFEGKHPILINNGSFEYEQMPLSKKDIFNDAYLISGGKDDIFLGNDYITPHHPDLLKNPVPIQFLKILPGVEIQFQFDLKNNLISGEEKSELFKNIILALGIGAKTNVGYGQFSEVTLKTGLNIPPINHDPYIEEIPTEAIQFLKKTSSPFKVIVSRVTDKHNYFEFQVGKNLIVVRKKIDSNPSLKLGDQAKLRIESDYHGTHNLHFKII